MTSAFESNLIMSAYDLNIGDLVMITGPLGTPSQKREVWSVCDNDGYEFVGLCRVGDSGCRVIYRAHQLRRAHPLEALSAQAD